jgi:hypothetical protein
MTSNKYSGASQRIASPISQVLGTVSVLPGESEDIYHEGLVATVQELGATTPLQIYLAEKIYECLWWMRRYENQKRAALIHEMARTIAPKHKFTNAAELQALAIQVLEENALSNKTFNEILGEQDFTLDSLKQQAITARRAELISLDGMIALKAKTLTGFQSSYEALVNRSVLQERLKLQNDLLKRDLYAIEVSAVDATSKAHDKRQAKSSK